MQCSKINTHSSKCMILLECLTAQLVSESSPTPSHLPKPCMRKLVSNEGICLYLWPTLGSKQWTVSNVIFSGLSSEIYQLGRLRRLIVYMWTTFRCISIGPSPTIFFLVWTTLQSLLLFLDNPPRYFTFTSLPSETVLLRNYLMHSLLSL